MRTGDCKSSEEKLDMPYLYVVNPYTKKHVNVLPMFKLLEDAHAAESGSLDNFIKPLQDMQDFLATEVTFDELNKDNYRELGVVNYNIVRLRKMFEAMAAPV